MGRRHVLVFAAVVAAVWPLGAQTLPASQPIDWQRLRPEILKRYRDLVKIDSTPGRKRWSSTT